MRSASGSSSCSMNLSFARRSGEINRASASSANTTRRRSGHSELFVELMLTARTPIRSAAAT